LDLCKQRGNSLCITVAAAATTRAAADRAAADRVAATITIAAIA